MKHEAFTVWFTGLSGSGKTTLARSLSAYLKTLDWPHELLDGDELRRTLCKDLGYSRADRDENVRRIAALAGDLNGRYTSAIVAAISPYREARSKARTQCDRFVEVYVECPIETLKQRDPKGLYEKALSGAIVNFSGVSDPYEAPEAPDIHLRTDLESEAESTRHLLTKLAEMGIFPTRA